MVIIQVVVIRSLDSQGRITLPHPIREKLKIQPKDSFFITYQKNAIILQKQPGEKKQLQFFANERCCFSGQILLNREEARVLLQELKQRR